MPYKESKKHSGYKEEEDTGYAGTSKPETSSGGSFNYAGYQQSDLVKKAQAALDQQIASKPGQYTSAWQNQLNDTIDKILNREQFSYDMNADYLYQQYKDQYARQGQLAMTDTMGQAAALTGGYGNSYAQTVGQQAYQGYMQQLNNIVPELYRLALDKYNREGDALHNQYALLSSQEQQDYGRYRDSLSDYNAELSRLQNQFNAERDYDYGQWVDGRDFAYGQFVDDRNYNYQLERDAVADSQWQKEYELALKQYQASRAAASGGGSGRSYSGGSSGSGRDYGDEEQTETPGKNPVPEDNAKEVNLGTRTGQQQMKSAANAEINAAYQAGEITAEEAAALRKIYAPRGYTY